MEQHFTRGVASSQKSAEAGHAIASRRRSYNQVLGSDDDSDEEDDDFDREDGAAPEEEEYDEDNGDEAANDEGMEESTPHGRKKVQVKWQKLADPTEYKHPTQPGFKGVPDTGTYASSVRPLTHESSPLEFFFLFWPPFLFESILRWTNANIRKQKEDNPSSYLDVQEFDLIQILRFFVILIKHGCCPMPGLYRRFFDTVSNFFWGDDRDKRVMGLNAIKKVSW